MRDVLSVFLGELRGTRVLDVKEEVELFKRIEKGDSDARQEVIIHNIRLVISLAASRTKHCRFMKLSDLIQEGFFGLDKAIGKFDYRRGNRFSTYAVSWIGTYLDKSIYNYERSVRIPVHRKELLNRLFRVKKNLRGKLKREPTDEELMDALNINSEKLNGLIEDSAPIISMNVKIGSDDSDELGYFFEDEKSQEFLDILEYRDLFEKVVEVMSTLSAKEQEVINRRFGLNGLKSETLQDVGKRWGITRERVRQIEDRAMKKLIKKVKIKKIEGGF